jgi:hypothetical protein
MNLCRHRSFRILAAVFCSIGVLAGGNAGSTTWMLLAFAAISSAVMLDTLLTGASSAPANAQSRVEVTR